MSNELSTATPEAANQLAMMLGAVDAPAPAKNRLPKLKVNTQRKHPCEGQFVVEGEGVEPVFAEKVTIRVLSQLFQWLHYDPEESKVVNKTLMIPNFRHEALDMKGTLRCGKPPSRILREASKEEQKKYTDITCFRQLRVLVNYSGKTEDGKDAEVKNQPAIMMLKGSNFNPFEDEVMKVLPKGASTYEYEVEVSAEEMQNGSVIYYVMHFEPNLKKKLPLCDNVYETMVHMGKMVADENEMIKLKHQEALHNENLSSGAIDALAEELEED
jgi:hypothetical protein